MQSYEAEYTRWREAAALADGERAELAAIAGDDKEIESRFFAPLAFGTAGLRGVLGLGINRMNVYTVRQATQGLAALICSLGQAAMDRGVALCYDCRHKSPEFAREAACVLAANGIRAFLFDAMRPTPLLSFAVRRLDCIAGINITASHNPKDYNGYKAYWEDGAQLPPAEADQVSRAIAAADIFTGVRTMPYDEAMAAGRVQIIGGELDEAFLAYSLSLSLSPEAVKSAAADLRIVYTPFHGTGAKLVPEILRRLGIKHLYCEPKQSVPDPDFSTVVSPNPEDPRGFALAVALAREQDAELVLGTDPDADRIGVVTRDANGEYVYLSGNQTGTLLLDYLIQALREQGRLPANAAVIKTIVTTEMARAVAEAAGVYCAETFTGFKFLAEQISAFEQSGSHRYLLAFEESFGYLAGDGCRDKDAVTAAMLIAEMAAWHKVRGRTLHGALEDLYARHGFYIDETVNLFLPGLDGLARIRALMDGLRQKPPSEIAGTVVLRLRDYLPGTVRELPDGETAELPLRDSNVLYFELADGTSFIVRPSGTEPKVRVYILLHGSNREECRGRVRRCADFARGLEGRV